MVYCNWKSIGSGLLFSEMNINQSFMAENIKKIWRNKPIVKWFVYQNHITYRLLTYFLTGILILYLSEVPSYSLKWFVTTDLKLLDQSSFWIQSCNFEVRIFMRWDSKMSKIGQNVCKLHRDVARLQRKLFPPFTWEEIGCHNFSSGF